MGGAGTAWVGKGSGKVIIEYRTSLIPSIETVSVI